MHKRALPKPPPGYRYIFRPWRRDRNGRVVYAYQFGLKAFPILVPE